MEPIAKYIMRGGQIVVIGEEPEFPEIDTIERVQRKLEIIGTCSDSRQNIGDIISMLTTKVLPPSIAETSP